MSNIEDAEGENSDQIAFWNSPHGEKWVTLQNALDAIHAAPLARLVSLASPTAGEKLLDVGCGAGASTLAFADVVGETGSALGIDAADFKGVVA